MHPISAAGPYQPFRCAQLPTTRVPPEFEEDDMTISVRSAAISPLYDPGGTLSEDQLAAIVFLARYSGRTSRRTGTTSGTSSMGSRPRPQVLAATGLTSRCTAPRWNNAALRRRRSIGACRPCAATSASPTSTAGSPPIPPSTCAAPRCNPTNDREWTGESAVSCSPPSTSTATTPRSAVLLGLNGLRVSRRAPPTSKISASNGAPHACAGILVKGTKPAMIPLVPRTGPHHRPRRR